MSRLSKRARWCCCSGCAVFVAVPLLLLILLLTPPPRPKKLNATERAAAVKKAEAVKHEVKAIAKAVKEGKSRDFRLEIGEAEVNEMLQTDGDLKQALQRVQVEDPYVVMEEGKILLTATRNVSGVNAVSTMSVNPTIDADGHVKITVESAQVGRLALPDVMTRRFADKLARELTAKVNEGKVKIRSLRVEPGQVVVEGSTR